MHGFAGYGSRFPQMMEYGHGAGLGLIAPIMFLIVGAALVAVLVWALTHKRVQAQTVVGADATTLGSTAIPAGTPRIVEDDALRIARERLARGEITVDEYTVVAEALRG